MVHPASLMPSNSKTYSQKLRRGKGKGEGWHRDYFMGWNFTALTAALNKVLKCAGGAPEIPHRKWLFTEPCWLLIVEQEFHILLELGSKNTEM